MSHRKVFGGVMESHEFLCDGEGCDASYEDAGSFQEVLNKSKSKGWTVTKDAAGNWCHYCPDCDPDAQYEADYDWRNDT